ncbi:MAG: quinol:cytochrome C oxidoreductase [Phycisphaerales bacterium]
MTENRNVVSQPKAQLDAQPQRMTGALGGRMFRRGAVMFVVGLAVMLPAGMFGGEDADRRVLYGYLINFAFVLSIGLGALVFVMIHHVCRTGAVVTYRRVGEIIAGTIPVIGLAALPVLLGLHRIYDWSHDPALQRPMVIGSLHTAWYAPGSFVIRYVVYLAIWSLTARWFLRTSRRQDQTGDEALTLLMAARAAPGILLFALTVTLFATDFIMSLDPHWFSTIFGVYYFAGGFLAAHCVMALFLLRVQREGLLVQCVNRNHYHDLGKMMFAMTVFWAYIGFSQYMLIWYGNIPEETEWIIRHGMSTTPGEANIYSVLAIIMVLGHFVIPFLGFMSRHIKRDPKRLGFWAVWLLAFCWLDLLWLIRPELRGHDHMTLAINAIDVIGWAGGLLTLGGLFKMTLWKIAGRGSLVAEKDPRLPQALAFENI